MLERAVNAPGGTFFILGLMVGFLVTLSQKRLIDYWMCSRVLHIRLFILYSYRIQSSFHADLEKRKEVYCCRLGGCIITIHLNT